MSTNQTETPVRANAFGCITVPFLLITLIPLAWGARSNWMNGQLGRNGEVVQGRVTEVRHVEGNPTMSRTGTPGGKAYGKSAIAAFTTRAGESRTATSSVNRNPAPWTVGETVDVVYDPGNPARADLRTEIDGWLFWFVIWCLVAALPATIALAPVILLMRQRRAQQASERPHTRQL